MLKWQLIAQPQFNLALVAWLSAAVATAIIVIAAVIRGAKAETMVLLGIGLVFFFQAMLALIQYRSSAEALQQIVLHDLAGPQVADGGDGMFLDRLVGAFAAGALLDRFHHDRGGQQEGQIAVELGRDHGLEHVHLIEHGEQGFEEPIHGEEGIGQHHAADDRAGDVTFVPLIAGEPGGHGEIALQDHMKAVDALAGAAVHLVRHRAGTARSRGGHRNQWPRLGYRPAA